MGKIQTHQAQAFFGISNPVHLATISLALVEDAEIRRINREFLGHDYPTDVISFRLDADGRQESGVRGLGAVRES